MALWGNKKVANNKPKYVASADLASVVGVKASEAEADVALTHVGWVQSRLGTGGVASVAVGAAGTGYANGDAVVAASTYGSGFTGSVLTNGAGAIQSVVINTPGAYTQAPALTITTTAGTTGALTATVGGRAGRVQKETLVAMGSMVD